MDILNVLFLYSSTKLFNGNNKSSVGMIVNGQQIDLKEAFPTEAVKHGQDKPYPTHDNCMRMNNKRANMSHIFQPRSYVQPSK